MTEVPPPDSDELFEEDEQEQLVQTAVQQARQYHSVLDTAKEWSREMSGELRVAAALEEDEETASDIEQVAELVKTVTARIEQGDNNRSRQP
jgi:hypothetical protein